MNLPHSLKSKALAFSKKYGFKKKQKPTQFLKSY